MADKVLLAVAGQPRSSQHAQWYYDSVSSMASMARGWGFRARLLFPEPRSGVDGPSTAQAIRGALAALRGAPSDSLLFLYVVGHGHFDGRQSWFLAADGLMAASDFRAALDPVPVGRMVLAFTPCQSGQFIKALAGPGRVVITSTLAQEDNQASFAEALRDGLASTDTVADAFDFARARVEEWYRRHGLPLTTEHPQISDGLLAQSIRFH